MCESTCLFVPVDLRHIHNPTLFETMKLKYIEKNILHIKQSILLFHVSMVTSLVRV